jgi:hypothetical protein
MTDTWRMKMSQRAMSIDNISFLSPPMSKPLQYEIEKEGDGYDSREADERDEFGDSTAAYGEDEQTKFNMNEDDNEDDNNNIIPWKKLLRKTNSRLNLIS